MKKRYLRPIVQDFLIVSALGKFCLLAIIDDFVVTPVTLSIYMGLVVWFGLEARLLIKYGGKPSLFIE